MKEPEYEPPTFLSRLTQDPVRLRRWARIAAVLVGAVGGLAGSGWNAVGGFAGVLMAGVWLLVPLVATGIGIGDAFFLRHGTGRRRVGLTLAASTLVAVMSCATLAAVSGAENEQPLLSGILYFFLTAAVINWLAASIGIAVGRSEGYLSRKIQNVDDRGW